jgi:hypothetical protein
LCLSTNKQRSVSTPIYQSAINDLRAAADESIYNQLCAQVCLFPGLEIEYVEGETGLTDMHVNLKFKKLLGSSPTVRKAQKGGHRTQVNVVLDKLTAEVGDMLQYSNRLYQVEAVFPLKNRVELCLAGYQRSNGDDNTLQLSFHEASRLVNEYNTM